MCASQKLALDELCVHTIRGLAMDAVQKANSGHPGTPMALAPLAYVLYSRILQHNPANPRWFNRDRIVLSAGHASTLLYSTLHLCGYKLTLDDLKAFRQLNSITPGHPEVGLTPGIETTTGPLGQGLLNAVGMAIAEAHLAAKFNRDGFSLVDHRTFAICSDGDFMEGASHEAASLAGHLGLGKLTVFYDDNHITIEGGTDLAYSDDVAKRFAAYHWHVQDLGEQANDLGALQAACEEATREADRPSLIIIRSHIAFGAPNMQDTSASHGAPLGEEEIRLTKKFYGMPPESQFHVPLEVYDHFKDSCLEKGKATEAEWNRLFALYRKAHPNLAKEFSSAMAGELPADLFSALPNWPTGHKPVATRSAGGQVLNALAERLPLLIGGSADLSPSTKTLIKSSDYFSKSNRVGRNIAWGIRELAMAGACNGLALHGGVRPFASTFFVFTDYARPAMRLSALMHLPVIYVMTHDSIGVGEDGPTHQPVEHLAALRSIPNLTIIRPADANETAYAWQAALQRLDGPTVLVLTRQDLPIIDRTQCAPAKETLKGAYILAKENGDFPQIVLIGSGSEVALLLEAKKMLQNENIAVRVVSMPSWEIFRRQDAKYREAVLPAKAQKRLAVEAAVSQGWHEWIGDHGVFLGVDFFGVSAPYQKIYQEFGLTAENVAQKARELL
ncbi:MAG TPA: transketolase [bacterium]|nr:transketolase [bacterium]HPG44724.1 transketolase [bacterium]HPM99104.1 transketolase [bacterium]